jgi:3-phosphoshikimate 1-carboxyvinyltransferase
MKELTARDIHVPGDISSAAFFIVGALLADSSDILLRNVGLNATRDGIVRVLKRMGGNIEILDVKGDVEASGDIRVRTSGLKAAIVTPAEIPLLIDEVPVLMVAAAMAEGRTEFQGISELKVKESDRVKTMSDNLLRMGVRIEEDGGSLTVEGGTKKFGTAVLDSFGDHRIAMAMSVAALLSDGECVIRNTDCADTSYPGFLRDLETLRPS